MTAALKTLLLPFDAGDLTWPEGPVLFLNGEECDVLPPQTKIQQYFKPKANNAIPDIPKEAFDLIMVLGSKHHNETKYFIGNALALLNESGTIICAASNDAGGKRLKKDLQGCGLECQTISKNKCQAVWATKKDQTMSAWIAAGAMQPIMDGAYTSQPGIFGWNKVDVGSALLIKNMPHEILQGTGADFGCGYGYLARHVMENHSAIDSFYCLDADYRAIEACKKNVPGDNIHYQWTDLSVPQTDLPPLDWVIMNPPFHEGKTAQYSIGTDFIKTAAAALKKGGTLWMVANAHLPYETVLNICFDRVIKVTEEQGFKIFHAKK